ncbi:MAG: hypothetical protein ACFBSE_20890 [Prochloraceae cyanobacterium]
MTQAGFDPQSCLRVINVLKNIPNTKIDTTHSSMLKQIDRLNELITTQNRDYLVLQGKKNLSKTEPLNYNLSEDRTSLKLNYTPKKNTSNDTAIFTIFF